MVHHSSYCLGLERLVDGKIPEVCGVVLPDFFLIYLLISKTDIQVARLGNLRSIADLIRR
jgi:hypothetical protein